jgi:hypothetical protein
MAWNILALIILFFTTAGFYLGTYSERDAWKLSNKRLRADLQVAYRENEELREHILSLRYPSAQR